MRANIIRFVIITCTRIVRAVLPEIEIDNGKMEWNEKLENGHASNGVQRSLIDNRAP